MSKGDVQLQPVSASGKFGLNDLLSLWEIQFIDLQSAVSTDKAVTDVLCLPAEGRPTGRKKASFGWPEVKQEWFGCQAMTLKSCGREEPSIPVSGFVL